MRLTQMLPKSEFPLRARATYQVPKFGITVITEMYYKRPFKDPGDSLDSFGVRVQYKKGESMLTLVDIERDDDDPKLFVLKNGRYQEVKEQQQEAVSCLHCARLLMKGAFGDDGFEVEAFLLEEDRARELARWKMF